MKLASLLLALPVVLGLASEARADGSVMVCDHTIQIAGEQFGFADFEEFVYWPPGMTNVPPTPRWSVGYFGPFGTSSVPFTAIQGLVSFCVMFPIMIALPVAFTVRWKKKRGT
jgi:hypothetical protein